MRSNIVRAFQTLTLMAVLVQNAAAQTLPTIEVTPALPVALQPFTVTVTYDGPCFESAFVDIVGDAIEITAQGAPNCITAVVPTTFRVDVPGLPGGVTTLELFNDPLPSQTGDEPRFSIGQFPIGIAASPGGVLDVEIRREDDRWHADVLQQCPYAGFALRTSTGGLLRAERLIGIPPFCQVDDPPEVRTIDLGTLTPGAYALAIEGPNDDPSMFDWIEPFYVAAEPEALDTVRLQGDRFAIRAAWQTADDAGTARMQRLSRDTAALWFFRAGNTEMLVKVLDGCTSTGYFWVFAAGLTNQGVELIVEDTTTGTERRWANPLGAPFAPILDTRAFACQR